jgi:hypothetical protein
MNPGVFLIQNNEELVEVNEQHLLGVPNEHTLIRRAPSITRIVGFTPPDFEELAGSTWRARHRLGGLIAKTLRTTLKRPYQSWGVKRRLELHIANENHYSFDDPFPFPKLFVYSKERLAFGFYIEAPLDPTREDASKYTYWRAFRKRLQNDKNLSKALLHAMDKHQLTLADYYRRDGGVFRGSFTVRNGSIDFESTTDSNVDGMGKGEFVHRITEPNTTEWMDLHIFKTMDKATALELKGEVATPILSVLQDLAPIYDSAIDLDK